MNKNDHTDWAIAISLTLVGLSVRIAIPLVSPFPLNDGGLFYTMILDLQKNHFLLPVVTTYNSASLPYAYPPAAFYIYASLNSLTGIALLDLMRLLPAVFSGLSIPAFYWLAREMLQSKSQAGLAALAFAFIPRTFDWLIMGGGITRSLGLILALLAMRQAYLLFSTHTTRSWLYLTGLGALVVYTHPEATVHTLLSCLFFFLMKDRSRKGWMHLAAAGAGIALLTAPWWGILISRFGINPFLAAANAARQDSYNPLAGIFVLFRFDFADEPYVSIFSSLGILGFFYLFAKREYLLPLWLIVMHTFEPRGGPLFMMIPLAMSAGTAIDQLILPPLRAFDPQFSRQTSAGVEGTQERPEQLLQGPFAKIVIGFIFIYGMLSAYMVALTIQQDFTLKEGDRQAFQWVAEHTPSEARFALITGGLPLRDAASEWFPALTGRQSAATVFGFEWVNDDRFAYRISAYETLQACATQDTGCLETWLQTNGPNVDFIYLNEAGASLGVHLQDSGDYRQVYDANGVEIFQRK